MALDRDIFWVGRQWAVTGFGVQAVDQRLKGAFDVAAARLWEDDLPHRMRELAWINIDDFDRALDLARTRFPAPPRKNLPLVESVLELIQPPASEAPRPTPRPMEASSPQTVIAEVSLAEHVIDEPGSPEPVIDEASSAEIVADEVSLPQPVITEASPPEGVIGEASAPQSPDPTPILLPLEPLVQEARPLEMRIEHVSAKFLPRWRIRSGSQR